MFERRICGENENTWLIFSNCIFEKLSPLRDKVEKYAIVSRSQVAIWGMCIVCYITETADTHCEYVMVIAFRRQKWLCVYMYVTEWNLLTGRIGGCQ